MEVETFGSENPARKEEKDKIKKTFCKQTAKEKLPILIKVKKIFLSRTALEDEILVSSTARTCRRFTNLRFFLYTLSSILVSIVSFEAINPFAGRKFKSKTIMLLVYRMSRTANRGNNLIASSILFAPMAEKFALICSFPLLPLP